MAFTSPTDTCAAWRQPVRTACVSCRQKRKEVKIWEAEEEGVSVWTSRKRRGGASIDAVPGITLNQTFLQKFVECAWNRLGEKVALRCKVPGPPGGNGLFLAATQAMLALLLWRSQCPLSAINAVFTRAPCLDLPAFFSPPFTQTLITLKSGFFLFAFLFVCWRKNRPCSCSGRVLVLSKIKGQKCWPGKLKLLGFRVTFLTKKGLYEEFPWKET